MKILNNVRTFLLGSLSFCFLAFHSQSDAQEKKGREGRENRPAATNTDSGKAVHSDFPKYPQTRKRANAGAAVQKSGTKHNAIPVATHYDSLRNHITDDHSNRIDFAERREESVMRRDKYVRGAVQAHGEVYAKDFRPIFEKRVNLINVDIFPRYRKIIVERPHYLVFWHQHHFYFGFEYGFHPCNDISLSFYNPVVRWMFETKFDPDFQRRWYKSEYDAYPELQQGFSHPHVWMPTENLRQLLLGVSGMSVEKQAHFRSAISVFTQVLAQNMANGLNQHVDLSHDDVIMTHYEILGYDEGVALLGTVVFQGKSYNFQGLLDLDYPSNSDVFIPANWEGNPTPDQLAKLDDVNQKINRIRGLQSSEGSPAVDGPQPPADVQADPQ